MDLCGSASATLLEQVRGDQGRQIKARKGDRISVALPGLNLSSSISSLFHPLSYYLCSCVSQESEPESRSQLKILLKYTGLFS